MSTTLSASTLLAVPLAPLVGSALAGIFGTAFGGNRLGRAKRRNLRGEILRPDGSEAISGELRGAATDAADLGQTLAQQLLARAPKGFFSHGG